MAATTNKGGTWMKIGVLGTGMVGNAIATKLVALGHEVCMGSRIAGNEHAHAWAQAAGAGASTGTFADAAAHGELLFACIHGVNTLDALEAAGREHLAGKVLVEVGNPLDFSGGMPPTLAVCNTDSLGEQVQRAFPDARVVKALNTMNCTVMVDPASVPGEHDVFVCGDDAGAKRHVRELLETFGWPAARIIDLGGIAASRGVEMYVTLWLSLYGAVGSPHFNIAVAR
jgi:8-hydroxy-5-deazaflavin:NADPH oxidoreductase